MITYHQSCPKLKNCASVAVALAAACVFTFAGPANGQNREGESAAVIDEGAAIEKLMTALQDADPDVRSEAAEELGALASITLSNR